MVALLVAMGVIAVVLSTALPVFSTVARREREAELVFRGQQYARAVSLFQRKYGNALPPNLDVLLNERFLRKEYKDPITGGEFQLVGPGSPELAQGSTPHRTTTAVVAAGRRPSSNSSNNSSTTAAVGARRSVEPVHSGSGSRWHHGRREQKQGDLAAAIQQSRQIQRVGVHRDADEHRGRWPAVATQAPGGRGGPLGGAGGETGGGAAGRTDRLTIADASDSRFPRSPGGAEPTRPGRGTGIQGAGPRLILASEFVASPRRGRRALRARSRWLSGLG